MTDIYAQAFEQGEGNEVRYGITKQLRHFCFAAQTIIVIDSCFTQAVYGQHIKRHTKGKDQATWNEVP